MRRLVLVILFSFLLASVAFVRKESISTVKASIQQGDLVIGGNTVYTIEGRFDINGSIIVKENATLILNDAILNFTPTETFQYNITLKDPYNGNPRLLACDSKIIAFHTIGIFLMDNSSATIDNSTISNNLYAFEHSNMSISSNSDVASLQIYDESIVNIYNSTIGFMRNSGNPWTQVYHSEISHLEIQAVANCSISNLKPGLIDYWNFMSNCSVNILPGVFAPNVTLTNVDVGNWRFCFYGDSNVSMENSTLLLLEVFNLSVIHLQSSACASVGQYGSSVLWIADSAITELYAYHSSNSWFLNSSCPSFHLYNSSTVHVSWYLDVHVIDKFGQNVLLANVTATYPNATVAMSRLTDDNGVARLALMEKMVNATGEYLIGNYDVTAIYETHSNSTEVSITGDREITLRLDFVIPEFPSLIIVPLFMIASLLATIAGKKKRRRSIFS